MPAVIVRRRRRRLVLLLLLRFFCFAARLDALRTDDDRNRIGGREFAELNGASEREREREGLLRKRDKKPLVHD